MASITVNKFIFNFTAQAAHFSVAALVMVLTARLQIAPEYVAFIGIVMAGLKEFWWDYEYEDVATRGSSLLDFSMYVFGIVTGYLLG